VYVIFHAPAHSGSAVKLFGLAPISTVIKQGTIDMSFTWIIVTVRDRLVRRHVIVDTIAELYTVLTDPPR